MTGGGPTRSNTCFPVVNAVLSALISGSCFVAGSADSIARSVSISFSCSCSLVIAMADLLRLNCYGCDPAAELVAFSVAESAV